MTRPSVSTDHKDFLLDMLNSFRWTINCEKLQLEPDTKSVFVGFNIYSTGNNGLWLSVLPVKICKLRCYIKKVINQQTVMVRMLAKIAGQCIAMTRAIIPQKLLLCNVYRTLAKKSNWEDELTIHLHCLRT